MREQLLHDPSHEISNQTAFAGLDDRLARHTRMQLTTAEFFHSFWCNGNTPQIVGCSRGGPRARHFEAALPFYSRPYQIERKAAALTTADRKQLRQVESQSTMASLRTWIVAQQQVVPEVSAIAKAINYSRSNLLFAGSLRVRKRAAAIMCLIHSTKLNGLEPFAHLQDVLTRLPTRPASRIDNLLPHNWQPVCTAPASNASMTST